MKIFPNLEMALSQQNMYRFIISHECDKISVVNGEMMKKNYEYIGFKDIEEYISMMDKFPHSHEVLYENYNTEMSMIARLAFDIDIKDKSKIYKGFQDDFEDTICNTIEEFYSILDYPLFYPKVYNKLNFVWTTSLNEKKYSKHLIVKGFSFLNNWAKQLKIFYTCMNNRIMSHPNLSKMNCEIIDMQLSRRNAMLRMPLNRKIGGNPLIFDDSKYSFYDGLMRVYRVEDMKNEILITEKDYVMHKMLKIPVLRQLFLGESKYIMKDDVTEENIKDAIKRFEKYNNGVFKIGQIKGCYINLLRLKSSECLISKDKKHDSENSFLIICNEGKVKYSCRRCIGTIEIK